MTYQLKQISVRQETPSLWRVAFNHLPINLVDHETLRDLDQVTRDLAASSDAKVRVKILTFSSPTGTPQACRPPVPARPSRPGWT